MYSDISCLIMQSIPIRQEVMLLNSRKIRKNDEEGNESDLLCGII